MRSGVLALGLLATLIAACAPAPAASTSAAVNATPSASPSASATGSARPGLTELRAPLEAGTFPAVADREALIVTRRLIDGRTTRAEAIELRTGAVTPLHETVDATLQAVSLRDGVLTLVESRETATPMEYDITVFAGRWRDASSFVKLDEYTAQWVGGDSWNPFPDPQTNGWEIAWLRATPDRTFELRLRDAAGSVRTIYAAKTPFSFALGRYGDVAIGEIGGPSGPASVALRLYASGKVSALLERPASDAGYVDWQQTRIVWSKGLGLVMPISGAERITPGPLPTRETVTVPSGCVSYAGVAAGAIAFLCGDHVQLESGTTIGPPTPQLHSEAIILTDQLVAHVFVPAADEPRPGDGAHF